MTRTKTPLKCGNYGTAENEKEKLYGSMISEECPRLIS
jgi:hypothetical protein